MDANKKETISGYVTAEIAAAIRAAAQDRGQSPTAWISDALNQRLEREGLIPSKIAETKSLTNEALATAEIVGPERFRQTLKRLRKNASQEKAIA